MLTYDMRQQIHSGLCRSHIKLFTKERYSCILSVLKIVQQFDAVFLLPGAWKALTVLFAVREGRTGFWQALYLAEGTKVALF